MVQVIGPDISFYQGLVDHEKLSQVSEFVIVRVGQNLWIDSEFSRNWIGAKRSGTPRGSYYFYDSRADPRQQARKWVEALGDDLGELPLFADFEDRYNGIYHGWRHWKDFLEELKLLVGNKEIFIYTNFFYWKENTRDIGISTQDLEYFHQYPLWIANYGVFTPSVPLPWSRDEWEFWQFESNEDNQMGSTYGVDGTGVDLNYYNGTLDEFIERFNLTYEIPTMPQDKLLLEQPYFDGAIYRKYETEKLYGKAIYHIMEIYVPKASFFVSPQLQSRKYVPDFINDYQLDFVINGDGWTSPPLVIAGYAVSEGKPYGQLGKEESIWISIFNSFSRSRPTVQHNAISYPNRLVLDGQVVPINKSPDDVRARTAWGYTKDQTKVFFLWVDGADYATKAGLNFQDCAKILADLGCDVAVMQDGGGSTTAAVRDDGVTEILGIPFGEDIVTRYPGYKLRRVANVLGVRMNGDPTPPEPQPGGEMWRITNPVAPRKTDSMFETVTKPNLTIGYQFSELAMVTKTERIGGVDYTITFLQLPDSYWIPRYLAYKDTTYAEFIGPDPVPTPKRVVGATIRFDDGSTEELFP